jgi:hypothetical protein
LHRAPTLPPKASTVRFAFHGQSLVVPKSAADDAAAGFSVGWKSR